MIRFFRTIRQSLLAQGRITRYLSYAIGEITLVMIGILLALQVNTWNEARKQNIIHGTVMTRLSEEFRALEPVVAELVAFTHSSRESTALVVNALRLEEPPADEHTFRAALARANWVQNVPQIAASYQELVSTGRLSDIRNVELRNALIRYGDAHERLERIYPAATSVIFTPGSNYYRAVDWNMDPKTWEGEGGIVSYDWIALRASRAEMQGWVAYQYDLALYAEKELQEIRTILSLLKVQQP
jgi:hypothetical protein